MAWSHISLLLLSFYPSQIHLDLSFYDVQNMTKQVLGRMKLSIYLGTDSFFESKAGRAVTWPVHILYGPQWRLPEDSWKIWHYCSIESGHFDFMRNQAIFIGMNPSPNAVSSSLDTSMASTYTTRYPLQHSWQLRVVELRHLSPGWIALFPFRKHTVYCLLPLWPLQQSIIYNVSVWRTRLNCLKYVSLLRDKHCHLSLAGMEEMTL